MATTVVQFDVGAIPERIHLPAHYDEALILVRRGVTPLALLRLPARAGSVSGSRLRESVAEEAAERLLMLEAQDELSMRNPPSTDASIATVAVCTRDRAADLDRCLTALRALASAGQEVLVVDSASASDATRQVTDAHPGVRYIREERPGLDIARNRALTEARGEIVAFCDDDAVPDPGWLGALLRNFSDPRTLCVTGLTLPLELETEAQEWFERTNAFSRGLDLRRFDGAVDDPFLVGRIGAGVNMALRRSALESIGAFDEALDAGTITKSGGDHDMFVRILSAGYCIVYEPAAVSFHRHRRDWQSLREALRGYGTGVYAHLTKHLLQNREFRALGVAAGWGRSQLRELLRALLGRPDATPVELVLDELRGCLAGPRAYLVSQRRLRDMARADSHAVAVMPVRSA